MNTRLLALLRRHKFVVNQRLLCVYFDTRLPSSSPHRKKFYAYVSVLHKEFTTAEVDISDDAGRSVPFEHGRTTVTFHFRRCKPLLFET